MDYEELVGLGHRRHRRQTKREKRDRAWSIVRAGVLGLISVFLLFVVTPFVLFGYTTHGSRAGDVPAASFGTIAAENVPPPPLFGQP
ncbi:MAG: hypothetical protein M3305_12320 [Actinomycetota bacterium]|nr:hypothetical protein [Actinomycetota bacterium]